MSTSNMSLTSQNKDSLTDQQKDNLQSLFGDDDDYLVLRGAEKERPRSAVFTHTIGVAVAFGGGIGAITGAVTNWNRKLLSSGIERSKFLTTIVRRTRNNAIRFGGFATLFSTTGVLFEIAMRPPAPPMPTEEEIYEMELAGQHYQPPPVEPLSPETQQWITTAGIMTAAVGMTAPKSWDMIKNAKKFENLSAAQSDAGLFEKQILKMYGKQTNIKQADLPRLLRRLAVTKMVGVVFAAGVIDYVWRTQVNEKASKAVKSFSRGIF